MTNEVFKIKVDILHETIQILEQPKDLPEGFIGFYGVIRVCRFCYPEFDEDMNTLYLRVDSYSQDKELIRCKGMLYKLINAFRLLCTERLYKLEIVSTKTLGSMK